MELVKAKQFVKYALCSRELGDLWHVQRSQKRLPEPYMPRVFASLSVTTALHLLLFH